MGEAVKSATTTRPVSRESPSDVVSAASDVTLKYGVSLEDLNGDEDLTMRRTASLDDLVHAALFDWARRA